MTLLATACGASRHASGEPPSDGGDGAGRTPWPVTAFPSPSVPPDNPVTDSKVALGRLLFYDPISSIDHQVACATCHSEFWGMSDGLPVSVGNDAGLLAGPGRQGANETRRNAMTLWNVAFRGTAFWDGRAQSIEDQIHFPFDATEEFDRSLSDVVADVAAIPAYASLFGQAFPEQLPAVTETTYAQAITSFERTLVTKNSLYDAYVAGDDNALDAVLRHGMALFGSEGCATCHVPPLFSSERFEDRGVPAIPGVADAGRFEVTGVEADRNRFKVPTLRNAHDTGPFFHTGAVTVLADAVAHEVTFSVTNDGAPALDDDSLGDITGFILKGLFDTSLSPTRPTEVPSGLAIPIDGFSISR